MCLDTVLIYWAVSTHLLHSVADMSFTYVEEFQKKAVSQFDI